MKGQRVADNYDGIPPNGSYWKWRGRWMITTPNGHIGNVSNHQVTEHEDGTITVYPSILVTQGDKEVFHGYLEKGEWRNC